MPGAAGRWRELFPPVSGVVGAEHCRGGVPSGLGEPPPDRVGEEATGLGGLGESAGQDGPVTAHRARDVERRLSGFAVAAMTSGDQRAGTIRIRVQPGDREVAPGRGEVRWRSPRRWIREHGHVGVEHGVEPDQRLDQGAGPQHRIGFPFGGGELGPGRGAVPSRGSTCGIGPQSEPAQSASPRNTTRARSSRTRSASASWPSRSRTLARGIVVTLSTMI